MNTTIAAIATPPGTGGIAVIRISGPKAVAIADRIFSGPVTTFTTHTVHFGKIIWEGEVIDEVLLIPMLAPKSFTGEDVVEIHCHGGSIITRSVLQAVLYAGAQSAGPGEFTKQAFLNGKLDLSQAEAVQSVIGAQNQLALNAAKKQLHGDLSAKIQSFQAQLLDTAAIIEAWVDFPEEGLEFATKSEISHSLTSIKTKMQQLADTFEEGKKIHEGLTLCLIGSPNAGKSSLMNALLGQNRAIVTPIPGTTRDIIEADLYLDGLHFQLIDTAGIRETEELVEREGIARSQNALEEADLILLVLDVSHPLTKSDHHLLAIAPPEKTLLICNKIDLAHTLPETNLPTVAISAKTKEGLDQLRESLREIIWKGKLPSKEEVILTNVRHKEALALAITDLETIITGLNGDISPEFLSADMRSALRNLSQIIGMDITEDILSSIFSKFCVGK